MLKVLWFFSLNNSDLFGISARFSVHLCHVMSNSTLLVDGGILADPEIQTVDLKRSVAWPQTEYYKLRAVTYLGSRIMIVIFDNIAIATIKFTIIFSCNFFKFIFLISCFDSPNGHFTSTVVIRFAFGFSDIWTHWIIQIKMFDTLILISDLISLELSPMNHLRNTKVHQSYRR